MAGTSGSEAELMRTCGHLYASIALESFATTLLALIFSYLLLLITNKGRLQKPGQAALGFVGMNVKTFFVELWDEVSKWHKMKDQPLAKRFAFCRKVNQAVCMFQILIAVLTIERWLHINNINGFRYLGYSITCPPMQSELIVLIAPVVPGYRLNIISTYLITMLMLWAGYAASMFQTEFYEGDLSRYLQTMDLNDLQPNAKFYFASFAMLAQVYLSFIQIPMLYIFYRWNGGEKGGLPHGYGRLLLNVCISWLAFPIWWVLSFEGMNIITDTKMNAAGFCFLNLMSKGSFTLLMLQMSQYHRRQQKRQECIENGQRPSSVDGKVGLFHSNSQVGLFQASATIMEAAPPPDVERKEESSSSPSRTGARRMSQSSSSPSRMRCRRMSEETWVLTVLRPYDQVTVPQGSDVWRTLEPTFRAYLVGKNIGAKDWDILGTDERVALREPYEATLDQILGEEEEGASTQAAGRPPEPLPTDKSPVQDVGIALAELNKVVDLDDKVFDLDSLGSLPDDDEPLHL